MFVIMDMHEHHMSYRETARKYWGGEREENYKNQIKRWGGGDSKFVPKQQHDLWLCTCGAYSEKNAKRCKNCGKNFEYITKCLDLNFSHTEFIKWKQDYIYRQACDAKKEGTLSSLNQAIELYEQVEDFKDSSEQILLCKKLLSEMQQEKVRQEELQKKRKTRLTAIIATVVVIILSIVIVVPIAVTTADKNARNGLRLEIIGNDDYYTVMEAPSDAKEIKVLAKLQRQTGS